MGVIEEGRVYGVRDRDSRERQWRGGWAEGVLTGV